MGKTIDDYISMMVVSDDGCWHLPVTTRALRIGGKTYSIVRLIYERYIGEWPGHKAKIGRNCGDMSCMSPEHIYHRTPNYRFWEKVERVSDSTKCWEWIHSKDGGGYGCFVESGSPEVKTEKAHRFSWRIHYGEIPKGLHVLHKCDKPSCVNPNHLFLGTNADNARDKMKKGRFKKLLGRKNGMNKLSKEDVFDIVGLHEDGYSYREIEKLYPVGMTQIGRIVRKESWVWLWD